MKLSTIGLALLLVGALPVLAQIGRRPTRPNIVRPEGDTWKAIRKNCTECHGIDDYAFYALDKPGWHGLLETKHKGVGGLKVNEPDTALIEDYLVSKFGPATKPFPRTYIPPEITTFFSDPEAKRLMDGACTRCHPITRVEQARFPEERWRTVLVDMRERGAKVGDEDMERLVEWLGRVYGTNQDK